MNMSQTRKKDENVEDLEYLSTHVNPILSRMMIKIINENPSDMVGYMISFLR